LESIHANTLGGISPCKDRKVDKAQAKELPGHKTMKKSLVQWVKWFCTYEKSFLQRLKWLVPEKNDSYGKKMDRTGVEVIRTALVIIRTVKKSLVPFKNHSYQGGNHLYQGRRHFSREPATGLPLPITQWRECDFPPPYSVITNYFFN